MRPTSSQRHFQLDRKRMCVRAARKGMPAQLEAAVRRLHPLGGDSRLKELTGGVAVEVEVLRVHLRKDFVLKDHYVDPERWQPLIYNFRHYYGLGRELGKTFRAEV